MATRSPTHGVLALIGDATLREACDRVCAAAAVPVVHAPEPSRLKVWTAAAAVLLDTPAAGRCAQRGLPRRDRVVLVCRGAPRPVDWQAAVAVGAQRVVALPDADHELMAELADAAEPAAAPGARGPVIAVIAGRGGAGASLFATALARVAAEAGDAILVDADPWGAGIDLVLGNEHDPGLRWPDLTLAGGRLNYAALRDALPQHHGVRVLSGSRGGGDIEPAPLAAVLDAGSRGGAKVVCDTGRRATDTSETALGAADLVIVMTTADIRSAAAAAVVGRWVSTVNPNAGVVVRGPAPGGLRARDVAEIVGMPLVAAMRPQPGVAATLERGGLRLPRRSPLADAARRVLDVLRAHPAVSAA